MKHIYMLILLCIANTTAVFSQNKNEIGIYFGLSDSKLILDKDVVGAASYNNQNLNEFGIRYLRQLSNKIHLETGLNLSSVKTRAESAHQGAPVVPLPEETLKMTSIPIYLRYFLGKHIFVNGGPLLDFKSSENSFASQSGLGYGLGVGGKLNIKNFFVFVNPNFKRHAIFKKDNFYNLTEIGVQIGASYGF